MKKEMFKGWFSIFSFTANQTAKGKGFKAATIGMALLIFSVMLGTNIIMAVIGKDEERTCNITDVYVVNESNIETVDFKDFASSSEAPFNKIIIENSNKEIAQLNEELSGKRNNAAILSISNKEDGFLLKLIIPEKSSLTTKDGDTFLDAAVTYFENIKMISSGLTASELIILNSAVQSEILQAGEESESLAVTLAKLFIPLLLALMVYIMVILYGQSISKALMADKASKLLEVLLVTVSPYSIIAGKILAMAGIAIFQMIVWIISGVVGFMVGDAVAKSIDSSYVNEILEALKMIGSDGDSPFSIPSIIVAFAALCLGFLLYCVLAGLISSFITKPEDLSSAMAVYQIPVIASWLAAYMLPLLGGYEGIVKIMRYFPLTAAYTLPADLLVGNINLAGALISIGITLFTIVAFIVITGKIYKKKLFN